MLNAGKDVQRGKVGQKLAMRPITAQTIVTTCKSAKNSKWFMHVYKNRYHPKAKKEVNEH